MKNLFITLLLIISCQKLQNTETDSEIRIYIEFINYLNELHNGSKIVISPITSIGDDISDSVIVYDTLGNELDYHWITWVYKDWSKFKDSLNFDDLKNNYKLANENEIQIYKYFESFKIDTLSLINYHSLYDAELKPEDLWSIFEKKYPGSIGLINVSRPGISSDGNWAIIHYELYCCFTEGVGYFILFKFKGKKWKVVESIESWVS